MRGFALLLVAAGLQLAAGQSFVSSGGKATTGLVGESNGAGSSSSFEKASAAQGGGDPILTGFDGRTFEFFGNVGATYSLLSEQNHQLSTRLKFAHMWDHNGTYMEAFQFRYRDHTVAVTLGDGDDITVAVDGSPITMLENEVETEHILGLAEGELQLQWQLHRPQYGNAVEVFSDMVRFMAWVTPAGTVDEGGVEQPAYLNFDLSLLSAPQGNHMEGIIGHTFQEIGKSEADDWEFHHSPADYEMTSFEDCEHMHNLFGQASSKSVLVKAGRRLLKAAGVSGISAGQLPVRASGRGASRASVQKGSLAKRSAKLIRAGSLPAKP